MSAAVKQLGIAVAVDGSPTRSISLALLYAVVTPTATYPPVPYPDSLLVKLEDEGRRAIARVLNWRRTRCRKTRRSPSDVVGVLRPDRAQNQTGETSNTVMHSVRIPVIVARPT